jgi:hypothetical protein
MITTVAGAVLGAFVVYQIKKRTKGILDDD